MLSYAQVKCCLHTCVLPAVLLLLLSTVWPASSPLPAAAGDAGTDAPARGKLLADELIAWLDSIELTKLNVGPDWSSVLHCVLQQ